MFRPMYNYSSLLLQSDNCETMSFLFVAISRSGLCYSFGVLSVELLWWTRAGEDLQAFQPFKRQIYLFSIGQFTSILPKTRFVLGNVSAVI